MNRRSESPTAPLLEHRLDVGSGEAEVSLGSSPEDARARSTTPGLRLTVRGSSQTFGPGDAATPNYSLALRTINGGSPHKGGDVQEMEVEILTEAVVDAVADAVGEVVTEAVQEAVQTAFEGTRFDFKANVYTIVAVAAAVLLERGIWNCWDYFFGDETLLSNAGSLVFGLAVLGMKHSDDTKEKISQSLQSREKSLGHRYKIALGRQGRQHSEETRLKIAAAVSATKRKLRRQRLAARAAAAAEEATADLRPAFSHTVSSSSNYTDTDGEGVDEGAEEIVLSDMFELEKSVIEMMSLRRQLAAWMDAYERRFGKKPDLTEASEEHPQVYGRFVRYVALRELVRRSSLAMGESPVTWD